MPADFYSIETAGTLKETEYIIYSRVPKCGSETTLDLMTNTSRLNNVTFEIHQNLKYFEHQQFLVDPRNVSFVKFVSSICVAEFSQVKRCLRSRLQDLLIVANSHFVPDR